MNAKELRAAASRRKQWVDLVRRINNPYIGTERHGDLVDKENIADYVLATVRDDDDEPVTGEWFSSLPKLWRNGLRIDFYDYVHDPVLGLNGEEIKANPTRGDGRRLAAALGIKLEEKT